MSKNLQKTLAGALATISTVSIATPVMAASIDEIYVNAYEAMRKAENDRTQASINDARVAIDELLKIGRENNDEHLISDGNTWSTMVDVVQHEKLVIAIGAIEKAQETNSQEDINKAYNSIENDLPNHWKFDFTSAIDIEQQKLTNEATKAVDDAEAAYETVKNDKTEANLEKAEEALETAKKLVESLATSVNADAKNWANGYLTSRINAINLDDIKLDDLKVTGAEFTQSGVTVTFNKLDKTLKNVTLTIEDNNGETVKVETVNKILVGKTQAEFSFTKYLKERPTGIWTVNGVEFNLTEVNFVNDVKEAKDAVVLAQTLKKEEYNGLVTYKADNVQKYFDAEGRDSLKTVADVQKLINKVDKVSTDSSDVEELINLAKNGTDTQFINGLASKNIVRVNSDWVKAYKNLIKNTDKNTLEAIQGLVDAENEGKIVAEIEKNPIKNKEITVINDLIDNYMNDEKVKNKDVTKKECMKAALEIQSTLVKIKNAGTVTKFKNNVETLKTLVSEFNSLKLNGVTYTTIDSVNNDLAESYIEEISKSDINTVAKLNDLINGTNAAKVKQAVDNVVTKLGVELDENGKFTNAQKTEIKTAFEELVKATAHEKNTEDVVNKFDSLIVDMNNLEKYSEINMWTDGMSGGLIDVSTVDALTKQIESRNNLSETTSINKALQAVKDANDKEELLKALQSSALGLDNLKKENIDAYNLDIEHIKAVINTDNETALKELKKAINVLNAKSDVVNAKDLNTMLSSLKTFAEVRNVSEFNVLSTANKQDAAEELLKVSYVNGELKLTDADLGTLDAKVKESVNEVKDNLQKLQGALGQYRDEVQIVAQAEDETEIETDASNKLRNILKTITGVESVSPDQATKFYEASLDKDGEVKTYKNYTEVKTTFSNIK